MVSNNSHQDTFGSKAFEKRKCVGLGDGRHLVAKFWSLKKRTSKIPPKNIRQNHDSYAGATPLQIKQFPELCLLEPSKTFKQLEQGSALVKFKPNNLAFENQRLHKIRQQGQIWLDPYYLKMSVGKVSVGKTSRSRIHSNHFNHLMIPGLEQLNSKGTDAASGTDNQHPLRRRRRRQISGRHYGRPT